MSKTQYWCCDCKFWTETLPDYGSCRRYPPIENPEAVYDAWPVTRRADWCGELVLIDERKKEVQHEQDL